MSKPESELAVAPKRAADRIRETARELFYRQGIRAIGVDEIVLKAGATKPSLYRSFASKDELAAAYLRDYDRDYVERLEANAAEHPGDPRGEILAWMGNLGVRAVQPGYRGCGMTNAVVEYPDPDHPAHKVSFANKTALRARLTRLAGEMGAASPEALGDGLLLLMEGAYATGQLFGPAGPAQHLAAAAEALIEAHLAASRVQDRSTGRFPLS